LHASAEGQKQRGCVAHRKIRDILSIRTTASPDSFAPMISSM